MARATARGRRRILPHGPVDLLRQIALFAAAYYVYRLTRGIADDPGVATTAFDHARDVIDIERTLNVFIEPSVQTFVSGSSKHGQLVLAKAKVRAPHCGTCHGVHSVRTPQGIEAQCKRCHAQLPASCAATPASTKVPGFLCQLPHAAPVCGQEIEPCKANPQPAGCS